MSTNAYPKELTSLIDKDFECQQTLIKVTANCPHKGSSIKVYTAQTINMISKAYAIETIYSANHPMKPSPDEAYEIKDLSYKTKIQELMIGNL